MLELRHVDVGNKVKSKSNKILRNKSKKSSFLLKTPFNKQKLGAIEPQNNKK